MRRFLVGISLLLGLVLPAAADSVTAKVNTDPPGATILDPYGNALGRTGQNCTFNFPDGTGLRVTLHLNDDYQDQSLVLTPTQLEGGQYQTEIHLIPKNAWAPWKLWLSTHWILVLPISLVLGLGLPFGAWKLRQRSRQQELERARDRQQLEHIQQLRVQHPQEVRVGQSLGGYRILKPLGQGAMGTVYEAVRLTDADWEERVAIKVLEASRQSVPGEFETTKERLRREVKLTRNLVHPNIVELKDWGEQEDCCYLVMELVRGQSLKSRIHQGPLSHEQCWHYLSQLGSAIEYAHQQPIQVIHRDLKPENLMLTEQDQLKVTDFGLASAENVQRITATGETLGTPAYMPPEQLSESTPRATMDQYAVGMIAYELLVGRLPFEATDVMQLLMACMSAPPPRPSSLNPSLNAQVDQVLLKMLDKVPEMRYGSVPEALAALQAALSTGSAGKTPGVATSPASSAR